LQYLKLLSSFAVVARHDHDGEHTRGNFGRRFQGAFLLVEVEKAVGVGDDGEVKGREMVWLLLACV